MSSVLNNLKYFNPRYENDHECPACPKVCVELSFSD